MRQLGLLLLAFIFVGAASVALASPVSMTYTGEVWTSSSANQHGSGNGLWDYEWDLAWTSNETVDYYWVAINGDVDSTMILSNSQTSGWNLVADSGKDYYTGVASDPYGVSEGQHVLLWENESATGTAAQFGVMTAYTALPGSGFAYDIGGSNLSGTTSGTTTSLTPEPGSMAVLLFGLGAVGGLLRKRKRSA